MASSSPSPSCRLPTTVRPLHYRVTITPAFDAFTFEGVEEIDVEVVHATPTIVLHALGLVVRSVSLGEQEPTVSVNEDAQTVTFTFSSPLAPGSYTLKLSYEAELKDDLVGFYRSQYRAGGELRYLGVTQFEATDARRALFCWDEPDVKATFDVTLRIDPGLVAISNMPIGDEYEEEGKRIVSFDRTPIMSTYLLAWVVGEFDFVEDTTPEGIQVRVYTPLGKKQQGRFALYVATNVLSFYTRHFQIPYPLPKLDLLAIPDFSAGAMENWGCVTYREAALLIDSAQSSTAMKQRVARIVSHELAHQWFGNLVTMKWWDNLWLNEGFARFTEFLAVDYLFPEYRIWETCFLAQVYTGAMDMDAMKNSHPIEVPVNNPAQINEIFDSISYAKGASVIRMLSDWIGRDAFDAGLVAYLTKHKYGNAVTEDLWVALADASGQPVHTVMKNWITVTGYPVVFVEKINDEKIRVTQKRYLSSAGGMEMEDDTIWHIPLRLQLEGSDEVIVKLLDSRQAEFVLPPHSGWIKLNAGQAGFYRVGYSPQQLHALQTPLCKKALSPTDRMGIQSDAFAMAHAGYLSTDVLLEFIRAYKDEDSLTVWSDLTSNLHHLLAIFSHESFFEKLKAYVERLYISVADKLGWDKQEGDSQSAILFRSTVRGMLAWVGHQGTIDEARKQFHAFLAGPGTIDPNFRFLIYRAVVAHGGEEEYESVLKLYHSSDFPEEKRQCLRALGHTPLPELIQRTLEFSISDHVRSQDLVFPLANCAMNMKGRDLAWAFTCAQWEEFDKRFGAANFLLPQIVSSTTGNFASETAAAQVETFFASHAAPSCERTVKQCLEKIRAKAALIARDGAKIRAFLDQEEVYSAS